MKQLKEISHIAATEIKPVTEKIKQKKVQFSQQLPHLLKEHY
jgi:hypothetical protein